jgi:hypothetical protein
MHARNIAAGSIKAANETRLDRIDADVKDDGNGCGRYLRCLCRVVSAGRCYHRTAEPSRLLAFAVDHSGRSPSGIR